MATPEGGLNTAAIREQLIGVRDLLRGDGTSQAVYDRVSLGLSLGRAGVNVDYLVQAFVSERLSLIKDDPAQQDLIQELNFLTPKPDIHPLNRKALVKVTKNRLQHLAQISESENITGIDTPGLIIKTAQSLIEDLYHAGKRKSALRWERRLTARYPQLYLTLPNRK